jgi:predicted HicB family RNase H-like nuclease
MSNTLTYKRWTASVDFDTRDKIIVGRVLNIDDVIVFHGESVAEFEAAFHAAVNDYLEACKRLKSAPEKPASGKVMRRIAPDLHAAANACSAHLLRLVPVRAAALMAAAVR